MDRRYIETVRLLIGVAPAVFEQPDFALKGGTAINLFVREMPRLSVDIDVVYTDYRRPRDQALAAISTSLEAIRARLAARGLQVESASKPGEESKLFVRDGNAMVKVEVNHVFRGTVLAVEDKELVDQAADLFTAQISVPTLATPELFGSKLVAAMGRQHPRDLFDVLGMYESSGLDADIVECFVCYLAGHNRPVHEVLFARQQDIARAYANEFQGMSGDPVTLEALLAGRDRLWEELPAALTSKHREFLGSLVCAEPDWSLMGCPHLAQLPAIQWKLQNLERLRSGDAAKFADQARLLDERFAAQGG